MKGIILHGGHGTRLRPLTHTGPKQLIPIANKPISQYVIESLRDAGITDIAIVLGNIFPEKVTEYYQDGQKLGVNITYISQGEPLGIAHAIGLCESFVGKEKFVVHLGDNLIRGGIKPFVDKFLFSSYDGMILLSKVIHPERFGVAEFDKNGTIINLVEKPKKPPSNCALVGIYFFSSIIFEMISQLEASRRGELEITEALQNLLSSSFNLGHFFIEGWWKDTGTPEDVLDSNRLILDELDSKLNGKIEDSLSIQGRVSLGNFSLVKRGAVIRGPVIIGDYTIVESGAYVGPYSSIGNNVIIKNGEIENSIVMDNCYIDLDGRIIESIVGPHSKIINNNGEKPRGYRFVLGEKSKVYV